MIPITRPVRRKARAFRRDVIVTMYPSGMIGVRQSRCRTEYQLPIETIYKLAIEAHQRAEKAAKAKAKKGRTQ